MQEYNGLYDPNLYGYFRCNDKMKHLQKQGLITKKGYIINKPEEYLRKKQLYKKIFQEEKLEKKVKNKSVLKRKNQNPYKEN